MKYARLENNIVMEIIDFNPEGIFSPELIFKECPDNTQQRHVYNEQTNEFNPPVIEEVPYTPTKEDINTQVIAKIRDKYSIDDEFKMQRFGIIDNTNQEYQDYLVYVNECVEWGKNEKAKYRLE